MSNNIDSQIQIYQAENGALEIKLDYQNDTLWLTQDQISSLFDSSRSNIAEHILNIFNSQELEQNSTRRKFRQVRTEGSRKVERELDFYNLDLIIAVGYRVNSIKATKFRQWATKILKSYLLDGYSLNQKLLQQKKSQIDEIKQTLDFLVKNSKNLETQNQFLEILDKYSSSLVILNQYDENRLVLNDRTKSVKIETEEFYRLIAETKAGLIAKGEATDLFGQEFKGKFEATIGAINQTFGGKDLYPTLEQKAAHLLYFTIKNHSFADGNKRIGSILFVYYLNQNNFLRTSTGDLKINQNTLVALALLVAQSNPDDKEILIQLVIKLIQE